MSRFPSLFVSHGAPTFALEPGVAGQLLADLAKELPTPRGIVMVSPHWQTKGIRVGSSAQPQTIHDFGGFPQALYSLQYPAPGAPELSQQVVEQLNAQGLGAQADAIRGLDHGAWVPLMHMYPQANIPVLQVSMPYDLNEAGALALGAALAPFAKQGVFIIGSGSLTHNLYEVQWHAEQTEPYVIEFVESIRASLKVGIASELNNLLSRTPHAKRAHPSTEHFLPLLVAAGATGSGLKFNTRILEGGNRHGMLSMESYLFTPGTPATA